MDPMFDEEQERAAELQREQELEREFRERQSALGLRSQVQS